MKIGVIGLGYVGQATYEGLRNYYEVIWNDNADEPMGVQRATDRERTVRDRGLPSDIVKCDIVFICVPTPMDADGAANTTIVESVIDGLTRYASSIKTEPPILVIKSTVPPGTTARLDRKFLLFPIVFNPEFLTEANYLSDFANQDHIIIGGPRPASTQLKQMYTLPFPNAHIVKTDSTYAELVKYMTNCFLATKVSFANEMYQICQKFDVDYDKVVEYATLDHRMGTSHWNVPGPDGHVGWSGSCFVKDLNALMSIAEQLEVPVSTMRGAWATNLWVRPEKDWETLTGRAVTKE